MSGGTTSSRSTASGTGSAASPCCAASRLSVPDGGLVGLIGPNGSGKTTLFNIISGYLPLQTGAIAFRGQPLTTQSVQDRSRAGMVRTFQTPKIFERMTVLENIMVGACKTHPHRDDPGPAPAAARARRDAPDPERSQSASPASSDWPATCLPARCPAGQRRILEIARAHGGRTAGS